MSTTYSLAVSNKSSQFGSFCVYQQSPDTNASDILTLAWFAEPAYPTTTVVFNWTVDYNFVWSNQGSLTAGVVFQASQSWSCDPYLLNSVDFNKTNGAYTFSSLTQNTNSDPGCLYINELGGVTPREASVGIGMSGAGTFVVSSQPNMKLIFKPKPTYYLVFGNYVQSQVMDITSLSNVYALTYGGSVTSQSVTLNKDNMWVAN